MIGACNALLATRVINITKLNYMGQFTDIRAKNKKHLLSYKYYNIPTACLYHGLKSTPCVCAW